MLSVRYALNEQDRVAFYKTTSSDYHVNSFVDKVRIQP